MTDNNDSEANCLQDEQHGSKLSPARLGHLGIEDEEEDDGRYIDEGIYLTTEWHKRILRLTLHFQAITENPNTNQEIVEVTPEVPEMKGFYFLPGLNLLMFEEINVWGHDKKQKGAANK